jgi:uncharacterized protein (DUF488 family)
MGTPIYTIGHSTRTLEDFQKLLGHYRIESVVDVRTVPKSRHVPHFHAEALTRTLSESGTEYYPMKRLGGLRKPEEDSPNQGWRNLSFRGFADYMQTEDFRRALTEVIDLALKKRIALMCAEALPWRCHRSLIADALVLRNMKVQHIISPTSLETHQLTSFAVVIGERITYPPMRTKRPRG